MNLDDSSSDDDLSVNDEGDIKLKERAVTVVPKSALTGPLAEQRSNRKKSKEGQTYELSKHLILFAAGQEKNSKSKSKNKRNASVGGTKKEKTDQRYTKMSQF